MTALGVHHVDTFNYLVGPAKSLFAFSKKLDSPLLLDETTAIVLEYERGPLGYIGTSFFAPHVTDLAVYGKDAVAWTTEDGKRLSFQRRGETVRTELPVETIDIVADEITEFATCVRTGKAPEIGASEGLEVVAVLEAVIESARSRRPVDVADFR
jgi:predicted dehydrogenase